MYYRDQWRGLVQVLGSSKMTSIETQYQRIKTSLRIFDAHLKTSYATQIFFLFVCGLCNNLEIIIRTEEQTMKSI